MLPVDTDVEVDSGAKVLNDARSEFLVISRWVFSGVIEAFFIVCLVVTQWLLDEYVISRYKVQGTNEAVLWIAEVLFAVATLIPILLYTMRTIVTLAIRTYRSIQKEINQ